MSVVVHYTRAAERDLEGIAAYTLEVWGPRQRDIYLDALEEACERVIPGHRRLAREVPERPGLFRFRVDSHVVYFSDVEDGIEVVRILHVHMLPSHHL
jgi:toxin ParE1/3/4